MMSLKSVAVWSVAISCLSALPLSSRDDGDDWSWIHDEVEYLAELKSHVTGSPNHTKLLERIESQLANLGFQTESDYYDFEYYDAPTSPPSLTIDGTDMVPPMYIPYSGVTPAEGVEGELVLLNNPTTEGPAWEEASGKIAILNLTTGPTDMSERFTVWPGSPEWPTVGGVAAAVANTAVNMTLASAAGVKGAIYTWSGITSGNLYGQYGPFKMLPMHVPALFLAGSDADTAITAAKTGSASATITLPGSFKPNTTTRTFWVTIPGTDLAHETAILTTHTDGTNVVQENGYLALLAQARALAASPPRRTTILLFLTGHLHTPAVTPTGRVLYRWLSDHPDLWNSSASQAVFGSTVEHLGAVAWRDDLARDFYFPTGRPDEEWLFAATAELATVVEKAWDTGVPPFRVSDPVVSKMEQPGEGLPFLWSEIAEVSLVTSPDWLLKEWPQEFDERQLMDVEVARRQIQSFLKVWAAVDQMGREELGIVEYERGPTTG